jgi:AraC family transcriptional regulator
LQRFDNWETLTRLLVHIQANLDKDLGISALGGTANLSPMHLQRVFKAAIGETPKAYVTRLRVERAAFCLFAHTSTVAEIGAACGFRNPETFMRAFRRRFGKTPSAYRATARARAVSSGRHVESLGAQGFELSKTRLIAVRPMHVAFRRHVGPYESVPESLFDELQRWAARRRLTGQRLWMGVGHDAPGVTPPAKLTACEDLD